MAVKYELSDKAAEQLAERKHRGERCAEIVSPGEELEAAARDAVSDILTAVVGPAGYCVGNARGDEIVGPWNVTLDSERDAVARSFLDLAYESWQGDAEDYDASAVLVENPLLPRTPAKAISDEVVAIFNTSGSDEEILERLRQRFNIDSDPEPGEYGYEEPALHETE